jgi:hypothetical protein
MPYDSQFLVSPTTSGASDVQTSAAPELETRQSSENTGEAAIWSPCYICFDSGATQSYSSLVVVRLLMHEIWTWENEMADDDQTNAECGAGPRSWKPPLERVPTESKLLPCHYFDFFYGCSHGGIVATLLGGLRMRVDDAADHFKDINKAIFRRRDFHHPDVPLRSIWKERRYKSEDLVKAVHKIVTEHCGESIECGGRDQLFRHPESVVATSPLKLEDPRQAQTCVVVSACFDGKICRKSILRTFKSGPRYNEHPGILNVPFSDQLNLTICQVLRAVMASIFFFRQFQVQTGTGTAWFSRFDYDMTAWYTVEDAMNDYESPYRRSSSSGPMSVPRPSSPPIVSFKRPISQGQALFLSIGAPDLKVVLRTGDPRKAATGTTCVHLDLTETLNDWRGVDIGPAIKASEFHAIHERTVNAVNKHEKFKSDLREIAREVVRRRRARQAMGGPRWEAFVRDTAKANDGEEISEVQ